MDPPLIKPRFVESKNNLLSKGKKPIPVPRQKNVEKEHYEHNIDVSKIQFLKNQVSGHNSNKLNENFSTLNNFQTDFHSFNSTSFIPCVNECKEMYSTGFKSLNNEELYGERPSLVPSVNHESDLSIKYRKKLEEMVENNASATAKHQIVLNLLKLDQTINLKYVILDLTNLLHLNKVFFIILNFFTFFI